MTPEIRECPERMTVMVRQVIHPRDIGRAIGPGAQRLRAQLVAAGAAPALAPYARYHSFSAEETDVEVGFEVERAVDVDGAERGVLSAGREAVMTHIGRYRDIPKTFAALEAWVGDHATARGAPREVYLTESEGHFTESEGHSEDGAVPDRRTEIIYPIR